jgi:DNA repair exonuclease SbcCD ATPase subunit
MNFRQSAALIAGTMLLGTPSLLWGQDDGVKRIAQLIKKANAQVQSINDAKQQLEKTVTAYNAVLAPDAKDRRSLYKKLQQELSTTDKKRAEVSAKSTEMNADADQLFKSWEASTSGIQSPELKQRSLDRLNHTRDRFAELRKTGQSAVDLYTPFMKTLQDQVTYLGHDLNPGAVASLKPDADKLNGQAKDLFAAIDKVTSAAHDNITRLSAE